MNLDIEIRASSTVKWRILFPESFANYHIRLVGEIGFFVMGIEIKASSNVRWRIISREFLSLHHSIDIMAINQLLPRLRGVTCILTADPRARTYVSRVRMYTYILNRSTYVLTRFMYVLGVCTNQCI